MKLRTLIALSLFAALLPLTGIATSTRDPRVDTTFFNGKDLAGWSTSQAKYWSVQEGAIVGLVVGL